MKTQEPRPIFLKDYRPSPYLIDKVALDVRLHPTATEVASQLHMRPNPAASGRAEPLVLDGEKLELRRVALDGRTLTPGDYRLTDTSLALTPVPDQPFTLEITTVCNPEANKALTGLYRSGTLYCTQCEPEGFRRITYYLDRPDVLATFRVRLEADMKQAPTLLANGNPVEAGELAGGRHFAVWEDPFPKPSYLFAMVGGRLGCVTDHFKTASGRRVELRLYCEPDKEDRCQWAMESLKRAMRWDEQRFGLEYDLDIFMIVAVSDFNMGAMENKGLNIFNDKLILARPDTASDGDYEAIEAVIAHEYFHNWTGNRVTCRDWFQLCLKEGLTVFRDQEFTSDMRSRAVKRIEDVKALRMSQFQEDAGPLAHPVRPESFIEINNFYTRTVYNKGAELCRMIMTLVGAEGFRKGMDLYFERHDGTAATVEDFVAAMADANDTDLSHFMLWYSQAGTPEVNCRLSYSAATGTARLTVKQHQPPTPGQARKKPLHIPLAVGLIGGDGRDLPLELAEGGKVTDGLLHLRKRSQSFVFEGLAGRPVASLLRGFSAPVKLTSNVTDRDLEFLMAHDSDLFNRWQAGQSLAMETLVAMAAALREGRVARPSPRFGKALAKALGDDSLDPACRAYMMSLPSEHDIAREIGADVDPVAVHRAREAFCASLGRSLKDILLSLYEEAASDAPYSPDAASAGRRALRNAALALLTAAGGRGAIGRLRDHYKRATNMTDAMAALDIFAHIDAPASQAAFDSFYRRWKGDHLVVDKWFAVQAHSPIYGSPQRIAALIGHPLFSLKNPNKVRAVLGVFALGNPVHFNDAGGKGYELVADAVLELNGFNPLMAARLLGSFENWRLYEPQRQAAARKALERIAAAKALSRDVHEIVGKILKQPENSS